MAQEKILLVDDEEDILELLKYNLKREGYRTIGVMTGEAALKAVETESPNLIILDLMLPGIDGLEIARKLKANQKTSKIPIIMLSAKGEESDVVTGLELGADDYITKPFSPRIVIARVKAMIRRDTEPPTEAENIISIHDGKIHPGKREVVINGQLVELTYTEFQVLHYLARQPGWVATRSQIVDAVKGTDYFVTDRSVDVQIVGLRKKLGAWGRNIETVRGVGYRFREQNDDKK